jgi:F0F1-type ATP synthase membrane subunit b/b'
MRVLKNITRVLFVAALIGGLTVDASAQKKKDKKAKKEKAAKELKRPDKVGHGATDAYVTSAFDLYEKNQEISKTLADASNNADKAGQVKGDLDKQMEEVKGLIGKSADVIKEAKTITPKTDSMKAVKAVNAATKALKATQEAIPGQLDMIKNQSAK